MGVVTVCLAVLTTRIELEHVSLTSDALRWARGAPHRARIGVVVGGGGKKAREAGARSGSAAVAWSRAPASTAPHTRLLQILEKP
jgi:hypothetical protein